MADLFCIIFGLVVVALMVSIALHFDRRREEREDRWRKNKTPLEGSCPRCGQFNHTGDRYCQKCGRTFRPLGG